MLVLGHMYGAVRDKTKCSIGLSQIVDQPGMNTIYRVCGMDDNTEISLNSQQL